MDYSKGLSLHRLYGHIKFATEAEKNSKSSTFVNAICSQLQCQPHKRYEPGWR